MSDLFDWRAHLKVHDAAEQYPLLEGTKLKELADDLKAHGMRLALAYWRPDAETEAKLIDGRNRLNALALAGILTVKDGRFHIRKFDGKEWGIRPLHHITHQGGDPYKLAASLNEHRRHLSAEWKRELITKTLKADPTKSDRAIAEELKEGRGVDTSRMTVGRVRHAEERRGTVGHVSTRTDSIGRVQPVARQQPVIKLPPGPTVDEQAGTVRLILAFSRSSTLPIATWCRTGSTRYAPPKRMRRGRDARSPRSKKPDGSDCRVGSVC
jgi:hypothetical protein